MYIVHMSCPFWLPCTVWPWDKSVPIKDILHDGLASLFLGNHHEDDHCPFLPPGSCHCWHLYWLYGNCIYISQALLLDIWHCSSPRRWSPPSEPTWCRSTAWPSRTRSWSTDFAPKPRTSLSVRSSFPTSGSPSLSFSGQLTMHLRSLNSDGKDRNGF